MYNNNNNNFLYQQQMQQMQFQMNNMNLSRNNNNNNFGYNNNNNNNNNNQYQVNNVNNGNNNSNNNYCMTQQQQLYLRQQMCQQNNNMNNNSMNNNNNYSSQYQYAQNQKAQQELQKKIDALQRQINQAKQLQAYQYQLQQRQQQQMKMRQHQQMNNQQMNNNKTMHNQQQQVYPSQNQNQNMNKNQYQQCQYQQRQQQLKQTKQQSQTGYTYQQQHEQHHSDHDDSMSEHSIHSLSSSQCTSQSMLPSPSVTPTPTPTDDTQSTVSTASFSTDCSSTDDNKPKKYKHRTSSKLQASLRWIIYNDQIDDYADMLCLNDDLKIYVINQCSKHSATHSACIKWSKKWNLINHPQCQRATYHAMSQSKINKKHEQKVSNKTKSSDIKGFDDLPICTINAVEDVIFVNNQETLKMAKEILLSERKYIGLDLECVVKEFPIQNAPKYCQVLQVATSTKTIVFDLQAIPSKYSADSDHNRNSIDPKEFDEMLYTIFYDSNVLKIGMSFDSDLKLLRKQYPFLKCFKCIIKSYFELEKVLLYLRTVSGQELFNIDMMKENLIKKKLAKTNTKREGGLPTIVRHILKQRLMKKEQLSNWARRPLRISQLQYAAIDAKIQLTIYDTLHSNYNKLLSNKTKSWVKDLSRY